MLRKYIAIIMIALFGAFATVGCSTVAQRTGNQELATYDERALIAAELGFSFLTDVIVTADQVGALTPERAARVLPVYRETYRALRAARLAYDANRSAEAVAETRNAIVAVAALTNLLRELQLIQRVPEGQPV